MGYTSVMETERRISHRLVAYWQQVKRERVLPTESDINPDDIADMWSHCFHIHIRDGMHFHCHYVGSGLRELVVASNGREQLVHLPPEKLEILYNEMLMTKLPVVENVEAFPVEGHFIKFRLCLLPLGSPNGVISSVFGGMRYKIC